MSSVKCWWPTLMIGIMHENHALLLNKGPTIEIWVRVLSPNSSQTPVLYFSKSTFLTFSSQIPTNSVNLTRFLPFPYMRNIEYLRGTLSSHEKYHIPTMRNGKTTEILSSLLWDSHKILWGIFVREVNGIFVDRFLGVQQGLQQQTACNGSMLRAIWWVA